VKTRGDGTGNLRRGDINIANILGNGTSSPTEKLVVKTYVKMRSDLFQTYAVIAAFFGSIGIAVYYDSVAEEWIPLREEHLEENGSSVSRVMIEVSKVFACAGILHSILAMVIIVIGLVFMTRLVQMHTTAEFMFNSQIWFFGWDSWDVSVAKIANFNLSASLVCFFIAATADVYNRVDTPFTYVVGICACPLMIYILYFLHITKKSWRGYSDEAAKVGDSLIALEERLSLSEERFSD